MDQWGLQPYGPPGLAPIPTVVNTGALQQFPFASMAEDVSSLSARACTGLQDAAGAAGQAALEEAMPDLAETLAVSFQSATQSLIGLGEALAAAANRYAGAENAIRRLEEQAP